MHTHAHPHDDDGSAPIRALKLSLWLNLGFLLVEAGVGLWTNSLALLSDAAHMLGDVAALVIALIAARLAEVAANHQRTYGLQRAEVLGGFFNAVTMLVLIVWICVEAVRRINAGAPELAGMPILLVGAAGLFINLASAWVLYRSGRDNLNVRGALLHMLADALGSVGAIVAALLVMAGYPAADAVVSFLIAGLILAGTWTLLRDSTRILLELPPNGFDVAGLEQAVLESPEVVSVHDLHVWSLAGAEPIVTAHLVLPESAEPARVRQAIECRLRDDFGITHLTLQFEDVGGEVCGLHHCGGSENGGHPEHH
ncbi:MAG: cation diffusion facilitator family transporter [Deltaproteobacteria bacterium]|nr:cation diffusion facilitator family transporter [Deltaproteobacteria bacterium]